MAEFQPIGEMLISQRRITAEQLDTALRERRQRHQRLGEVLVELGFVTEDDIVACLASQFGFPTVDPSRITPDRDAIGLITPRYALDNCVLPIRNGDDVFECAIADPINVEATDAVLRLVQKRTIFHLAPLSGLRAAISRAYGLTPATAEDIVPAARHSMAPKPQKDRAALLAMLDQTTTHARKPRRTCSRGANAGLTPETARKECDPS